MHFTVINLTSTQQVNVKKIHGGVTHEKHKTTTAITKTNKQTMKETKTNKQNTQKKKVAVYPASDPTFCCQNTNCELTTFTICQHQYRNEAENEKEQTSQTNTK